MLDEVQQMLDRLHRLHRLVVLQDVRDAANAALHPNDMLQDPRERLARLRALEEATAIAACFALPESAWGNVCRAYLSHARSEQRRLLRSANHE